ncbi:MAG: tRNA (adenosine(37)-N6)-threonylcarbamoyltransferase complex ATPase subunit type 1 TsaE, partial [Rhodobacteraceae bacterium]|nr:tRNA (adenosine(37)-N6)-threonylcarbamoyltransferase complex ATPase subunit type 1 TsaE [Paracoccaceae bacterium]
IDDVEELGLLEAFDTAICLIEWPDIMGPLVPDRALRIEISTLAKTQERGIDLHYEEHHWSARLERLNDC